MKCFMMVVKLLGTTGFGTKRFQCCKVVQFIQLIIVYEGNNLFVTDAVEIYFGYCLLQAVDFELLDINEYKQFRL